MRFALLSMRCQCFLLSGGFLLSDMAKLRSACRRLDSPFCLLTVFFVRKQVGELFFETVDGLSICAQVFFLVADHEL